MAGNTREFEFIVGPETSEIPTAGEPTDDEDLLTLEYANAHYFPYSYNTFASPFVMPTSATQINFAAIGYSDVTFYLKANAVPTTSTANPQIGAGTVDGDRLTLVGTDDTLWFRYQNGNGLDLNGDMILKANCRLSLQWDDDASLWREMYRRG